MPEPQHLHRDSIATPIGELVIIADGQGHLRAVDWLDHEPRMLHLLARHCGREGFVLTSRHDPGGLSAALRAYFKGALAAIDQLPVTTLGTVFQRAVWRELRCIPRGETISYAELARRVGRPAASATPWAWPMAAIPSASSYPATGLSGRTGCLPAMAAELNANAGCSRMSTATGEVSASDPYVMPVA